MEEISGDNIAAAVLQRFDTLPKKIKPLDRGGGVKEWATLSGMVAQGSNRITCISAATGMKCLPQNKVPQAQGIVLHDWHAEILAIRSFNRFLLEECHILASSRNASSEYLHFRDLEERTDSHFQPFALNEGISLHMYCSEAPCGDASMELIMAAQEDPTPWELPPATKLPPDDASISSKLLTEVSHPESQLTGRSYFSKLGIVRRKPSRPDAPPTLSKSCSDKLSLKQCTSLLSSITSLLISPQNMYLTSLVLPSSQYSTTACTRAFSSAGRMKDLQDRDWGNGYNFRPFEIKTTSEEFTHSRRQHLTIEQKTVPSNISASFIHSPRHSHTPSAQLETLIGGILQGRKANDIHGASKVCKKRSWKLALEIATMVAASSIQKALSAGTYGEFKNSDILIERRRVKEDVRSNALKGWVRNLGDEGFDVDGVDG